MGNMAQDYQAIPELDQYEDVDIDAQDYQQMGIGQRRAADAELDRRDGRIQQQYRRGGQPAALDDSSISAGIPPEYDMGGNQGQLNNALSQLSNNSQRYEEDDEGGILNLEDYQGPLHEWL